MHIRFTRIAGGTFSPYSLDLRMADTKSTLVPTEPPPSYEASSSPKPAQARSPGIANYRGPLPLDLPALTFLRSKRVILASASPRRKQLLAQIGLHNLEVIPSTAPENLPKSLSPFEYVLQTATQKALTVYKEQIDSLKGEPTLILAADTVVVSSKGEILEKPRSEAHHISMLKGLRDTGVHKVFTAVAVMSPLESAKDPGYALETAVEETAVKFDSTVTDELIIAYVRTREGVDKAGGYGIQGVGSLLVEKIEGSFDNVVGLPLRCTLRLIEKALAGGEEEVDGEESDEEEDLM